MGPGTLRIGGVTKVPGCQAMNAEDVVKATKVPSYNANSSGISVN